MSVYFSFIYDVILLLLVICLMCKCWHICYFVRLLTFRYDQTAGRAQKVVFLPLFCHLLHMKLKIENHKQRVLVEQDTNLIIVDMILRKPKCGPVGLVDHCIPQINMTRMFVAASFRQFMWILPSSGQGQKKLFLILWISLLYIL